MEKQKININIDYSEPAFFTENVTVSHNQSKFIIDFIQATPRFDQIGSSPHQTIAVKHKTIIMDPALAKIFLSVLKQNIQKYERKYGKIGSKIKRKQAVETKYIG